MTSFPWFLLKADMSVLDLFCAGFLGGNARDYVCGHAALYVGVDSDKEKIHQMRENGRAGEYFQCEDVFELLDYWPDYYDLVIADPWTGMNDRVYERLDAILALSARDALIGTNIHDMHKLPLTMDKHTLQAFWRRSDHMGGTYWAIYTL